MLAKRIIPTLLMNGDKLVKGRQFNSWRSVGHIMQAAEIYAQRGVDEIVLLDIAATPEGRGPNLKQIEKVAAKFYTPLTVGGGVRSVDDVRDLLKAGADKVAIGSGAFDMTLLYDAAEKFGSQAIAASIDYRGSVCYLQCGKRALTSMDGRPYSPLDAALSAQERGAGEILLTSIEREGTLSGYDLETLHAVSSALRIPVIAHGGCGAYQHMREAIDAGASAVAAGAMFQFIDATPRGAAQYLAEQGIEARV